MALQMPVPVLAGVQVPRRRASVLLGVVAAMVGILLLVGATEPQAVGPVFGLLAALVQITGIVAGVRAATRPWPTPTMRWPWWGLALTPALGMASGVAYGIGVERGTTEGSLLAVSIALRLVQYPLFIGILLSMPARRLTGSSRLRFWLDLLTVIGGAAMVAWYLILGRAVTQDGVDQWIITYPVGDLLVLFTICAVLLRGVRFEVRRSMAVLLMGLTSYLVVDLLTCYGVLFNGDSFTEAQPLPLLAAMLVSAYLMAVAPLVQCWPPEEAVQEGPRRERGRRVAVLPYVGLGVGYLTLALAVQGQLYPWAGLVAGVVVMTGAVTGRQVMALREVHRLGVTDALTGLANRRHLTESLAALVSGAGRDPGRIAVLLLDLDGFKGVNDTFGHAAGDELLVAFARNLTASVPRGALPARLGGDEFAVVLPRVDAAEQADEVARAILRGAGESLTVEAQQLHVQVSIGVAWAGSDESVTTGEPTTGEPVTGGEPMTTGAPVTAEELLRRADVAMYTAKRAGGHRFQRHTLDLDDPDQAVSALERDLREALERHDVTVEYQPIVDLADGQVVAVESLVRWVHPQRGAVPVGDLLSLAESTGLIHLLGHEVLRQACAAVQEWQRLLPSGQRLDLSVNISAAQLTQAGFADHVRQILRDSGLAPTGLILELTNAGAVHDEVAIDQIHALRALGVRIAVDDFGSGYSSLEDIARLPVDILKLDRCFIGDLNSGSERQALAEAVIRLARMMHLDVAAKGIEEAHQASELNRLGYGSGQGYHFARPMAPQAITNILTTGSPWSPPTSRAPAAGARTPAATGAAPAQHQPANG